MEMHRDDKNLDNTIKSAAYSFTMEGFQVSGQHQKMARDILTGKTTAEEVIEKITSKYISAAKR